MARARPSARELSKNTVSPSAIATTMESARNIHALAEIAAKAPAPAVASTQTTRITPPMLERTALTPTGPSSSVSVRARRRVTAHATAEPSAARAPSVVSEIIGEQAGLCQAETRSRLDNSGIARRRSYTVKILVAATVLVGGFVLLSLVSFWLAVRPPRIAVPFRPEEFRLAVEDVTVTGADGVKPAGWLAARPGAPALVLLHGYPAEKADLLPLAAALAPRFTVLLLDQRYFGASGGRATTIGFRERGDLRRAIDFLAARGFTEGGGFGLSLGGAGALLAPAPGRPIRPAAASPPS